MTHQPLALRRRAVLAAGAGLLGLPAAAIGQAARPTAKPLSVVQVFDGSPNQQDVSRDFLVGSRAAWQEWNSRGGLRGRTVQHSAIEVDGTAGSLEAAVKSIRENPGCIALSGTVSDPVAGQLAALLRREGLDMAHIAPWLQDSSLEIDAQTFPVFAGRQEQIGHALKSLSFAGLQQVGAVFASARERSLYQGDVARTASALRLQLHSYQGADLAALGQGLGPTTPAVLLFIGGTPELVQFTQGMERQSRQRYLVALADVNLLTVAQMGGGRNTPVIATQPVPMVTSALPVVRRYREVLARLFDEPPVALGLAGFIAAAYTQQVLEGIDGALNRASVLAAMRRRADADVGGYRVRFDAQRRSATYVTQSMLAPDGRVVG